MREYLINESDNYLAVYIIDVDNEQFEEQVDRLKPVLRAFNKNIMFRPISSKAVVNYVGSEDEQI